MPRFQLRSLVGLLLGLLALAGFLGVAALTAAPPPVPAPNASLEQAITLLTEARQRFQGVQDYVCTLVKRERVHDEMLPENVITLEARTRPSSIHLRWQTPHSLEGQEVCYVAGRNEGMMRVHPVGIVGIVGFVSVQPRDPRALKDNRHTITEAGLAHLLDSIARQWEQERVWNKTVVRILDSEYNHRPCWWIETIHPDPSAGTFYGYRCVLCLDKATLLPVYNAAYGWPHPGGDPQGDLLESYGYLNLRCNVGLDDEVFNR